MPSEREKLGSSWGWGKVFGNNRDNAGSLYADKNDVREGGKLTIKKRGENSKLMDVRRQEKIWTFLGAWRVHAYVVKEER